MAGKAMVQWPSPVLVRSSRFRPMSPASQVGLEAYRFESCPERFFFYKSNKISTFCASHSVNTLYPKG